MLTLLMFEEMKRGLISNGASTNASDGGSLLRTVSSSVRRKYISIVMIGAYLSSVRL